MQRKTTVAAVCGLLILADLLMAKQTMNTRGSLSWTAFSSAIAVEAAAALLLAVLAFAMFWPGRKPPNVQKPVGLVQPLRRLFVSVWP